MPPDPLPAPERAVPTRDWLRRRYETEGASIGEIAAELGVSQELVRRQLIRANIPRRRGGRRRHEDPRLNNPNWLRKRYLVEEATAVQIAQETGVHVGTVSSRLREFGITLRPQSHTKLADRDWLYQRYITDAASSTQIAAELEVSPNTVTAWLRRHGIPVRPRGGRHPEQANA